MQQIYCYLACFNILQASTHLVTWTIHTSSIKTIHFVSILVSKWSSHRGAVTRAQWIFTCSAKLRLLICLTWTWISLKAAITLSCWITKQILYWCTHIIELLYLTPSWSLNMLESWFYFNYWVHSHWGLNRNNGYLYLYCRPAPLGNKRGYECLNPMLKLLLLTRWYFLKSSQHLLHLIVGLVLHDACIYCYGISFFQPFSRRLFFLLVTEDLFILLKILAT